MELSGSNYLFLLTNDEKPDQSVLANIFCNFSALHINFEYIILQGMNACQCNGNHKDLPRRYFFMFFPLTGVTTF